jgi:hypothetical protein
MLIDEFMQTYDVMERHKIKIRVPAQRVYDTMRTANLFSSPIVRALFFLRGLPGRLLSPGTRPQQIEVTINKLLKGGFILLGEDPPHEFLIGAVERFWAASAKGPPLSDAVEFSNFTTPGFAKAVMNLSLTQQPDGATWLVTETRVFCLDDKSRRRFRLYWLFIGPFSSLIRKMMLHAIKREAEGER